MQPDGKILTAGFGSLSRLLPNGSVDPTFGGGDGEIRSAVPASAIVTMSDGRILGGGAVDGGYAVARYLSEGALDPAFGGGDGVARLGATEFCLHNPDDPDACPSGGSIAIQWDGRIVVAGGDGLARFTADGSPDTAFGGGDGVVSARVEVDLDVGVVADRRPIVEGLAYFPEVNPGPTSPNIEVPDSLALTAYSEEGPVDQSFGRFGVVLAPRPAACLPFPAIPGYIVRGTIDADRLFGTRFSEVINGFAGADVLHGRGGGDVVCGGGNDDRLFGNAGDDRLLGQPGDDRLFGEFGDDVLFGGPGSDLIFGGPGTDRIRDPAGLRVR